MKQLEIEYFFPLTEQISLDLDYQPCIDYAEEKRKKQLYTGLTIDSWGTTGSVLMSTGLSTTWTTQIGNWEVPSEAKQPSKFQKFMAKYFLGWKWKGK
jgi:hypothetical protein